jgi:hypothetical protein
LLAFGGGLIVETETYLQRDLIIVYGAIPDIAANLLHLEPV